MLQESNTMETRIFKLGDTTIEVAVFAPSSWNPNGSFRVKRS